MPLLAEIGTFKRALTELLPDIALRWSSGLESVKLRARINPKPHS